MNGRFEFLFPFLFRYGAVFGFLMRASAVTLLACSVSAATAGEARAAGDDALQGVPLEVQLEVLDLHKDAELIGMRKSRLVDAATAELKKMKVGVSANGKLPALIVKVTTLDVGPRIASHVTLELKEVGRLPRLPRPVFVTSWTKAKMVASEPTKHEDMVVRAITGLIDDFVKEAHE